MPKALYVHVPFCEQICHYCDFNKFFLKNQPIDDYLECCKNEMKNTLEKFPQEINISSIYVGGGTPTSLSTKQLYTLLEDIRTNFSIDDQCEWTVEVNPGSVSREKLQMMKEVGVNRLSIGVQTFDEDLLKTIGRDHRPEDIPNTIRLCREVGFENISIDLMFGLPGQTIDQLKHSIKQLIQLKVEHVSAYSLKVEPKTVFYQRWQRGNLHLPGEDREADMYRVLQEELTNAGFEQYEISNFAKPGTQSTHNLTYWENEEYYGIGAGAHSYVQKVRRINHGPLPKYMNSMKDIGFPYLEEHEVSMEERMEEEMFMGLRKLTGVSRTSFYEKYDITMDHIFGDVIDGLKEKGLLQEKGDRVCLTKKGLLLGNEVFEKFLLATD
ncbi:radical SAM family heme chaperone HemW [Bacillus shivajii]|uniref:radical SAM family heme chaperone HemW n=1 Tax=Bacillus shivajii TaxID=1983719 RepID=UPI001CF9ABDB|nr:radical SAM family heme chaperone HemW [Bacillus shivajii]UCZ54483.1 radical SAM family heme chaperone HemW [Bacillus shivajii]